MTDLHVFRLKGHNVFVLSSRRVCRSLLDGSFIKVLRSVQLCTGPFVRAVTERGVIRMVIFYVRERRSSGLLRSE